MFKFSLLFWKYPEPGFYKLYLCKEKTNLLTSAALDLSNEVR